MNQLSLSVVIVCAVLALTQGGQAAKVVQTSTRAELMQIVRLSGINIPPKKSAGGSFGRSERGDGLDGRDGRDGSVCPEPPVDFINRIVILGSSADPTDNSESEFECPDGMYVSRCACQEAHLCDGVTLSGNAQNCSAFSNGAHQDGAKPVLKCKEKFGLEDVRTVRTATVGHALICPEGYVMEECYLHDTHSTRRTAILKRDAFAFGQMSCSYKFLNANDKRHGNALVTAVCVRHE